MHRLAKFDVARQFDNKPLRLGAQIVFGIGCALALIGLRTVLDVWAATAGPFALLYPAVLIATLYGHWQAGLTTFALSFLYSWFYALAPVGAWYFEIPTDAPRVALNGVSLLLIIFLAEAFRRAVATALQERDAEIEHSKLLQQEIEHRTKNNFALAISLLEMQKRREAQPAVAEALEQAIARIHSFAAAYANLAVSQGRGARVAMQDYLLEVVDRVTRGGFGENVVVEVDFDGSDCSMPREVAVAIGLFTNEALTNCAKYAFPDGRNGTVRVKFAGEGEKWSLDISDDGVGTAAAATDEPSSGIGERLLSAFAQQAQAEYAIDASTNGRSVRLASQTVN